MIYYLKGEITQKEKEFIVIDVAGVGYKVLVSSELKKSLKGKITIFCFVQKTDKEDRIYGFKTKENLELFESLLKISGIGPKTALRIASFASIEELKEGIEKEDKKVLNKIFSIGEKKGQQVIFELSRKFLKDDKEDEVTAILKNLGFDKEEIKKALLKVSPDKSEKERVEEALKILGK